MKPKRIKIRQFWIRKPETQIMPQKRTYKRKKITKRDANAINDT